MVLAGGSAAVAWRLYTQPGPLEAARDVVVPHGGVAEVARALQRAGVITASGRLHVAAEVMRGPPLRAAEFRFPAHASLRQVLAMLRFGKPVEHRLTISEGLTAAQIAELLDRATALSGDVQVPPEGAVLPETYEYQYGTSRAAMLARAGAAMERALAAAWANRAADLPLTSPEQALILASIVERETSRPDERPRIAAVFLNRLRAGMRLQSDPTVIYASSGGMGVLDRSLLQTDMERMNPYNTYRVGGLPPGPIDSPGLASVQAVLHPAQTDDLYFVADGTGGHAFAQTLKEHLRNVSRWRSQSMPGH
jgi:UPF0755 protein